jgi:hypothetical protein
MIMCVGYGVGRFDTSHNFLSIELVNITCASQQHTLAFNAQAWSVPSEFGKSWLWSLHATFQEWYGIIMMVMSRRILNSKRIPSGSRERFS